MNIVEIRKIMDKEGIIFSFSGLISQNMLVGVVETIKKELAEMGADNSIINSIFIVAIEQMQNIMNYATDKKVLKGSQFASQGICVVGFDRDKDKYFVASSNRINENDKQKVQNKIDKINSMDDKDKRKYLRELLRSGKDTHNRGAGVGFVEMGKRSSEDMIYRFSEHNNNDYFELKVYI